MCRWQHLYCEYKEKRIEWRLLVMNASLDNVTKQFRSYIFLLNPTLFLFLSVSIHSNYGLGWIMSWQYFVWSSDTNCPNEEMCAFICQIVKKMPNLATDYDSNFQKNTKQFIQIVTITLLFSIFFQIITPYSEYWLIAFAQGISSLRNVSWWGGGKKFWFNETKCYLQSVHHSCWKRSILNVTHSWITFSLEYKPPHNWSMSIVCIF